MLLGNQKNPQNKTVLRMVFFCLLTCYYRSKRSFFVVFVFFKLLGTSRGRAADHLCEVYIWFHAILKNTPTINKKNTKKPTHGHLCSKDQQIVHNHVECHRIENVRLDFVQRLSLSLSLNGLGWERKCYFCVSLPERGRSRALPSLKVHFPLLFRSRVRTRVQFLLAEGREGVHFPSAVPLCVCPCMCVCVFAPWRRWV